MDSNATVGSLPDAPDSMGNIPLPPPNANATGAPNNFSLKPEAPTGELNIRSALKLAIKAKKEKRTVLNVDLPIDFVISLFKMAKGDTINLNVVRDMFKHVHSGLSEDDPFAAMKKDFMDTLVAAHQGNGNSELLKKEFDSFKKAVCALVPNGSVTNHAAAAESAGESRSSTASPTSSDNQTLVAHVVEEIVASNVATTSEPKTVVKTRGDNGKPAQVKRARKSGGSKSTLSARSSNDVKEHSPEIDTDGMDRLEREEGEDLNQLSPSSEAASETPPTTREASVTSHTEQSASHEEVGSPAMETPSLAVPTPSPGTSRDQIPDEQNNSQPAQEQPAEVQTVQPVVNPKKRRAATSTEKQQRKRSSSAITKVSKSKTMKYCVDSDSSDDERSKRKKKKPNNSQAAKDQFRNDSLTWFIFRCLEYGLQVQRDNPEKRLITVKREEKIANFLKDNDTKTDTTLLRAPIDLKTRFPDENNYRFCLDYFRKLALNLGKRLKKETLRTGPVPENPPSLHLIGPTYLDYTDDSSKVLEKAGKSFHTVNNLLYKTLRSKEIEKPCIEAAAKLNALEKHMFLDSRKGLTGDDVNRLPCPVIDVMSRADLFSDDLKRIVTSASISIIKGLGKAAGIDTTLFEMETIAAANPDQIIDILNQAPQSADGNYSPDGIKCWKTTQQLSKMSLTAFNRYLNKKKEESIKAMVEIAKCKKKNQMATARAIFGDIIAEQEDVPEDAHEDLLNIKFGTNIDLWHDNFRRQMEEILGKLPDFLKPEFAGNILNYCGVKVYGINTVQLYSKPPGVRTPAHMENSLMASINWNIGPGTCIWFSVPYEYWGKVEALVNEHRQIWQNQDYWPDEEELLQAGIPVIKFEQKRDELVYVNTGSFHWVQSTGFCVNISWNVGQPTFPQLATSVIAAEHNLTTGHIANVPLVNTIWNMAREKLFCEHDREMYPCMRNVMLRTLGHCKMYLDYADHHEWGMEDVGHWENQEKIYRCSDCQCEIFNIIRWAVKKEDKEFLDDPWSYCSQCKPQEEFMDGREIRYTYFYSIGELAQVYDDFVPPEGNDKFVAPVHNDDIDDDDIGNPESDDEDIVDSDHDDDDIGDPEPVDGIDAPEHDDEFVAPEE